MQTRTRNGTGDVLQEARRRFQRWRRSRQGCGRIPHELWRMATEAAVIHGTQTTASELKLDLARLKGWVQALGYEEPVMSGGGFVELAPLPMGSAAECTLELEHRSGCKLRVWLKGQATAQAFEFGQMLWRGRS